jgi:hypothetical protein
MVEGSALAILRNDDVALVNLRKTLLRWQIWETGEEFSADCQRLAGSGVVQGDGMLGSELLGA